MTSVAIEPFVECVSLQVQNLRALRDGGKKILGYFCTYTPVELLHAAGFVPMRVMGGLGPVSAADSLSPSFICPYMRRALEKALGGEYDFLSGMVQGYTCDVACGMMGIWEQNVNGELLHTLPLPYNDNPDGRRFFRAALDELVGRMAEIGGRFSEESLDRSLNLYRDIRGLVLELYQMRYDRRLPLSAQEFLIVILAGFVSPPEKYRTMLRELIASISRLALNGSDDSVPVLVSGSLVEDPRALDILEQCGGRVVADDLCTGLRNFQPPSGEGLGPMERLIDRYMHRLRCPARSRAEDRAVLLTELAEQSRSKGVVFLFQKFCTPHLADHPLVTEELKKRGIPSIMIEMEETGINEGQMRTRLEAFYELLRP